jgi:hypothetical protein
MIRCRHGSFRAQRKPITPATPDLARLSPAPARGRSTEQTSYGKPDSLTGSDSTARSTIRRASDDGANYSLLVGRRRGRKFGRSSSGDRPRWRRRRHIDPGLDDAFFDGDVHGRFPGVSADGKDGADGHRNDTVGVDLERVRLRRPPYSSHSRRQNTRIGKRAVRDAGGERLQRDGRSDRHGHSQH